MVDDCFDGSIGRLEHIRLLNETSFENKELATPELAELWLRTTAGRALVITHAHRGLAMLSHRCGDFIGAAA